MAQMKCKRPENVGEACVWDLFRDNFPADVICYNNLEINGREFDECILIPDRGLFMVEVKGWHASSIDHIGSEREVYLREEAKPTRNPKAQVNRYRYLLLNCINKRYNINPFIYGVVCYPFITESEYYNCKLNYISEPEYTLFREDIENSVKLLDKFNKIWLEMFNTSMTPLNNQSISYIRSYFEPDFNEFANPPLIPEPPYSILETITNDHNDEQIDEYLDLYFQGTKLILFTSTNSAEKFISRLSDHFNKNGIKVLKENLAFFSVPNNHLQMKKNTFTCFNLSIYVPEKDFILKNDLKIIDGEYSEEEEKILRHLEECTDFNFDQYKVEHAPFENIFVKAGAGTGKTYSMISRIAFLYHKKESGITELSNEVGMLTFTNEAANNMKSKIKKYFMNAYILTERASYLDVMSDIEQMQISTIHKFANEIIRNAALTLGIGHQYSITDSDYERKQVYYDCINEYLSLKGKEDANFFKRLPEETYKLVDLLMEFSKQLYNKGCDVKDLTENQLGISITSVPYFNELLIEVAVKAEKIINQNNVQNNKVALSQIISFFKKAVSSDAFKSSDYKYKYIFIDEFQDTDDMQIEIFLTLHKMIGFKFFVVGDLKQSIYRFRGATLDAFQHLIKGTLNEKWIEYSLNINYRTDHRLLEKYDPIFSCIGNSGGKFGQLLPYGDTDVLSSNIKDICFESEMIFYHKQIDNQNELFNKLFEMIEKQKMNIIRQEYFTSLPESKRTIAVLVRKNWQVTNILNEAKKRNINIETVSGGDLYQSEPALDLYKLLSALCYTNDPKYLFTLIDSDNIHTDFSLQEISGFSEDKQTEVMIDCLDIYYGDRIGMDWKGLISMAHEKPILVVLKQIYEKTSPWVSPKRSQKAQSYYRSNYDLIIEKMIRRFGVETLTLETAHTFLKNNILTSLKISSRDVGQEDRGVHIVCMTVHKSKGLEFESVIMPYTDMNITQSGLKKIDVIYLDGKVGYSITFDQKIGQECNEYYALEEETEQKEKEEARILYVAMTRAIGSFSWITSGVDDCNTTWNSILAEGGSQYEH